MAPRITITGSNLQGNFAMGDNAVSISSGGQTLDATTHTGNFDLLAAELKRHQMAEPDIAALRTALEADQGAPSLAQQRFGPAISSWLQKMLGKALDATWQIEISVVSGLLTAALQKYYGW
nr:hypothetical protein [uncultured Duganella sp.]